MTCELQISDAETLQSTLEEMMNTALSSSSNLTAEAQGVYIDSLTTTIEDFYSSNYGMSNTTSSTTSSGCTSCSGNGVCQYNALYLVDTCQCNTGWTGDSCAISSADDALLQALKTAIFEQIAAANLSLTFSSNWSQPYLDALLTLINPSACSLTDAQSSINIVANIINNDYNLKTVNDTFDPQKMTVTTQIIDSCLTCVYETDCLLENDISQQVYNTSVQLLTELAVLQLWQKLPDSGIYTLDSTNLEVLSDRVSASKLNGLVIAPPDAAKIVFQQKSTSASSSSAVDIEMTIWKTNIMICPSVQKEENTPPPVTISINNQDSLTSSPVTDELSASISYPITSSSSSQTYSDCSSGCSASITTDPDGTKYFQCNCQQLSALSSSNQLKGFFAASNLYKLAMAGALSTFDYLHAWPFWMLWALFVWVFLTIFAIKARIVKPFRYGAKINIRAENARMPRLERDRMKFFKSFWYGIKVRVTIIKSI